ncbi:MAG: Tetratricopeptide repeat protein [Candidatus Dependentiae bacterium ADurb.Bin331]|nr:MAG: Tetratricopeptide repeat protein [Candidatus Dependentiae bacterium ADurb.Bin331]
MKLQVNLLFFSIFCACNSFAVELNPWVLWKQYQASSAFEQKEFAHAEKVTHDLITNNPQSSENLYNAGKAAYAQKNWQQAATYFDAALQKSEASKEIKKRAFFDRGNAQINLQQLDQARESYQKVVELDPEHTFAQEMIKKIDEELERQKKEKEQEQQNNQKKNDKQQENESSRDKQNKKNNDQEKNNEENKQKQEKDKQNSQDQKNKENEPDKNTSGAQDEKKDGDENESNEENNQKNEQQNKSDKSRSEKQEKNSGNAGNNGNDQGEKPKDDRKQASDQPKNEEKNGANDTEQKQENTPKGGEDDQQSSNEQRKREQQKHTSSPAQQQSHAQNTQDGSKEQGHQPGLPADEQLSQDDQLLMKLLDEHDAQALKQMLKVDIKQGMPARHGQKNW